MKRIATSALFAALVASGAVCATQAFAATAPAVPAAIAAAVADSGRPEADRNRDANRKPAEVVAFAGVKPGDKVADLLPGGGYFTRIFAKTVGPAGKVYAVVPAAMAARPGALDAMNAIATANPNLMVVTADLTSFTLPEKLDVAWTSENYHDLKNGPTSNIAAFNKAVFDALKPGGVFYVEDHAAPGTGSSATQTLHRIDPETVKSEVQAAGFRLEAESQLLANPADPHTARSSDPSIQGRTDKFVLKFRKPA